MIKASTLSLTMYCSVILLSGCLDASGDTKRPSAPEQRIAPEGGPPIVAPPAGTAARNPTDMVLMKDERKIFGWISGARSYAGYKVQIKLGQRTHHATVDSENTFRWYYKVTRPTRVKVRLAGMRRSIALQPAAAHKPSAFFVVDRPVFRPGQQLGFALFLRRHGPRGELTPIRSAPVEVRLTSARKGTVVARLKLRSDALGRAVGSYRFSAGDPLDDYTLSVPGHVGAARVRLAEFRKSKVKLVIAGKVQAQHLRLRFSAVDFLGSPARGSKVNFEAQVVRRAAQRRKGLRKGLRENRFVLAANHADEQLRLPRLDELPEDERLLLEAGEAGGPDVSATTEAVVARHKGELELGGQTAGVHEIALKPRWLRGGYVVRVKGVVVDANGREQRAYRQIALLEGSRARVALSLNRRVVTPGEPLRLRLRPRKGQRAADSSTLVVQRLERLPGASRFSSAWQSNRIYLSSRIVAHNAAGRPYRARRRARAAWVPVDDRPTVGRELITAQPITDGAATLTLPRPGAYKLVVLTKRGDRTTRSEIGCVVREAGGRALRLALDRDALGAGQRLRGTIHSRYSGARVLLSIRDGHGIRAWRAFRLVGQTKRLNLKLPGALGYHAVVDVQYLDRRGRVHVADASIRVHPARRIIKTQVEVKRVVRPGEQVELKLRVDRAEPVDLVVSVYDQSLLGIAPDRTPDIRDFYLADGRARDQRTDAVLQRRLGRLTLGGLLGRVGGLLKRSPELLKTVDGAAVRHLVKLRTTGPMTLHGRQLVALLRLIGEDVRWLGYDQWYAHVKAGEAALTDLPSLFNQSHGGWRLARQLYGEVLVLAGFNPQQRATWAAQGNLWAAPRRRHFRARGDAHHSASGNAFHSVSGQAFVSHLPAAAAVSLLQPEGGAARTGVRTDFSDLAYFNARVRTDARGRAVVRFKVPDSLTNWRVVVTAVSRQMHVGRTEARFRTFKPIMVWPMVPRIFTAGDRISVYARVHNRTGKAAPIRVGLQVKNGKLLSPARRTVQVKARSSAAVYWTFEPGKPGFTQLLMSAVSPAGEDASLKRLPVTASAAEEQVTRSGFADGELSIELPKQVDPARARLTLSFAPSLAADLVDNLDYLVQYPYGCVEQTMSRFLPAIKVAQTLDRFQIRHPGLRARLPKVVAAGIKRLLELQKQDGGWGWQGRGATHEMMTPYALYGLLQAERAGYEVGNKRAVTRGLRRLRGFITAMGERQTADRIYAIYVYAHRHAPEPSWWRFVEQQLKRGKLSDYALALGLELAARHKRPNLARRLARALRRRAVRSGEQVHWRTAGFSRWGDDRYEVTAAALKALVAHDFSDPLIHGVLTFFASTKRGNRWNSTKDTAMVTYAIADYLARQRRLQGSRTLVYTVNGGARREVRFAGGLTRKVTLPGRTLRRGPNVIRFYNGSRTCLLRAVLRYTRAGRHLAPLQAGLLVQRRLYLLDRDGTRRREIKLGQTVPWGAYLLSEVSASAAATAGARPRQLRYVLVESPKPSGCEVLPEKDRRFNQRSTPYVLREDRTAMVAFHHELTPARVVDRVVLHAEFSGAFVLPPARAELMYKTQTRGHSGTFHFKVAQR
jgi:Alpha-2-macroglobulin family/A-macroglobulin TED domain/MG2 domain/Alpha-2-macroglobulin bait region domain/Bacterial Alpha-2-macroglobulin MG10 domain